MKKLYLAMLTLLALPQNNQCVGPQDGLAIVIAGLLGSAAAGGAVLVGATGFGIYWIGKKVYDYRQLTPATCADAAKQVEALKRNPEASNKELAQLFSMLNRCQNKFGNK
jgi:hypothetical protein